MEGKKWGKTYWALYASYMSYSDNNIYARKISFDCPQLLIKAYAVQYIIDDIRLILLHPVGDAEKTIWC